MRCRGPTLQGGERYSLVLWFSDSSASLTAGTAPWVGAAAAEGNSDAQFILGGFHYRGEFGFAHDLEAAVRWFNASAQQGNPLAQLWMATLYANGEGVEHDYRQAAALWRQAAEQEHASAQHALGWAHRDGLGVPIDKAAAVHWFRRAAAQGLERANDALTPGSWGWGSMSAAERETALVSMRKRVGVDR